MKTHPLYLPSLVLASLCAVVIAVSPFLKPPESALLRPLTWVAGGALGLLFLWMLASGRRLGGIEAANRELRAKRPFRLLGPGLTDPEWGLFGSRSGPKPLAIVRAVLWAEFMAALVFAGRNGSQVLLLASAAFGLAIVLSVIHVGLNTGADTA